MAFNSTQHHLVKFALFSAAAAASRCVGPAHRPINSGRSVLPGSTDRSAMDGAYVETFSDGPGGWSAWGYVEDEGAVVQSGNPGTGPISIPLVDGCLRSSSPWWCDFLTAWRLRV